jgi:hypothetical protein
VTARPAAPVRLQDPLRRELVEILARMLVAATRKRLDEGTAASSTSPRRRTKGQYSKRLRSNLKPTLKARELPQLEPMR